MVDVYGMTPINRTAGLVTGQAGCTDELTLEQERDNLVSILKRLQEEHKRYPKNSLKRKYLGKKIHEIQMQINAIRPKLKAKGVEHFIIDILREDMTKAQFSILMDRAARRMRES